MIATVDDHEVMAADIVNVYVQAQKVSTVLGPEFSSDTRMTVIIKALDCSKSTGAAFRSHTCMEALGICPVGLTWTYG